ncbi:MAG: ABC transporter permease [Chloroflexi bacterium]|nr:ABC transporter permease [Chloroflexota bacterium]
MSWRHLKAIIRKEINHMLRDRMTFVLVMMVPITMLFIMAYALTADIEHVPIAVLDLDRSSTSRTFIQRITEGEDLDLYAYVDTLDEVEDLLMHGKIKAALVINPAFERDLLALRGMGLQIIIDGTEPQSGGFAVEQIGGRAGEFVNDLLTSQMQAIGVSLNSLQPIDLSVRALYNPGLKPRVDMIPGLISMMLGFPALSVALTLAHEREHGTLEQVMVTPVGRAELLLGKMIPYVIVGLINVIVMPVAARVVFHIPFNGSFLLFFLFSAAFLFAILGMGMIIGVFMRTQPTALALSFLVIFFPGFFMTGIFFPIASMPEMIRLEALALPGTHYAIITRGVFLTGVGLDVLWPYGVALIGLGLAFMAVSALFFKKKLG